MVQGIYFLSSKDFSIKEVDSEKKLLYLTYKTKLAMNLVLFYSNTCEHCEDILTYFKILPKNIIGCNFSIINVLQNPEVVELSKKTISPISYVPDIYLYINSLPYLKYEGEVTLEAITDFILEVSQNIKNSFSSISETETNKNDVNKNDNEFSLNNNNDKKIENNVNSDGKHFLLLDDGTSKIKKKNNKVCYLKGNQFICT